MDYLVENWGSFVGVLGLLASVGGLVYALLARRAAKSAELAANDARQALTRTLRLVDVQEAIDLIDRLKDRLLSEEWPVVRELYSSLQSKLSDVRAALPSAQEQYRESISNALDEVAALQGMAYPSRAEEEFDIDFFDGALGVLNTIQQDLRTMRSDMMFSGEGTGI